MIRLATAPLIAFLLTGAPASAQSPSRPGPWAIDVRGVTGPVPEQTVFYPPLDRTALIPGRGLGLDLGVHVYLLNLGPARLGIGADLFYVRGRTRPLAVRASAGRRSNQRAAIASDAVTRHQPTAVRSAM